MKTIKNLAIVLLLISAITMTATATGVAGNANSGSIPDKNNVKNNVISPNAVGHYGYQSQAWVSYGPISLGPHQTADWPVPFGGTLPGSVKSVVVSLSIPWTGNNIGHAYSINTENNYLTNSYQWVQVTSLDDSGIPDGTWINLAADFGSQNY